MRKKQVQEQANINIPKQSPLTEEQLKDPEAIRFWLFSNSYIALDVMWQLIPQCNPNEALRICHDIYKTSLNNQPLVKPKSNETNDMAKSLAEILQAAQNSQHFFDDEEDIEVKNEK
jgi:hypothetical protein